MVWTNNDIHFITLIRIGTRMNLKKKTTLEKSFIMPINKENNE